MTIEKKISNKDEYKAYFLSKMNKKKKLKNTFRQALESRKFEIELYWKRATYFWSFIAAAFAGYFVLISIDNINNFKPLTVVVSFIGTLFSLAWYLVNRGSKYWQENWENHVYLMEDEIIGPVFSTVLNPKSKNIWHITEEYPFSVSKINQILSFGVLLVWIFILSFSIDYTFDIKFLDEYAKFINGLYFVLVAFCLIVLLIRNSETRIAKQIKKDLKKEIDNTILISRKK